MPIFIYEAALIFFLLLVHELGSFTSDLHSHGKKKGEDHHDNKRLFALRPGLLSGVLQFNPDILSQTGFLLSP